MTVARFTLAPANLSEAMELARMISNSNFCPAQMKGKPGDVILALQMGSEIGLGPMQAIQNISVINGRPSLWGDALVAVAMSSPNYISHREWTDGNINDGTLTAHCAVIRKNSEEHIRSFSMSDAKKASLWGKTGPWTQYPERMLQMRARGFAIRDKFPDTLRGIQIAEEASDYQVVETTQNPVVVQNVVPAIEHTSEIITPKLQEHLDKINDCVSEDTLKTVYLSAMRLFKHCKEDLAILVNAKDVKKAELEEKAAANAANPEQIDQAGVDEFLAELDEAEKGVA